MRLELNEGWCVEVVMGKRPSHNSRDDSLSAF